ncbi:glycerol 3-phosphatase 1 [Exophiala aquamarina CBS 119918]|uniref:Glycerol 3-phosphatase 1 n=1 Tax=Exophiala aquamarina CBS 119918 TaxID=1182545 RepID=A0A072PPN0_9EURO|nr:glycerol 3-phosphatase 1 [Exophiala aquamarina CBS 119918]KEF62079.1 glycerol 3-phosphatase 1 [Exophiala aquamarina CBS 119918]
MALSGFNTPISRSETPLLSEVRFRRQTCKITVSGILSDMDGTLIDSTNAIVKHWERIGQTYGIDPKVILATSHGRRSIDVFQTIDPANANWDFVRQMEGEIPTLFGNDAEEILGARQLFSTLELLDLKWAIVTSGTRPLVEGWLKVLKLLEPEYMITAEDETNGKPDPEPY